ANTGAARTATLTIAGQPFTVTQAEAAPTCAYALAPTSYSAPATGGPTSVAVATSSGCSWTTTGLPSWMTFTSGDGTGSGTGTVNLTVQANTGAARTATLTIAGRQFTISQAAGLPPCVYVVTPTVFNVDQRDQSGPRALTITIQTASSCAWTASITSGGSWLTIRTGTSGTGNGSTVVEVARNSGDARTGTLIVAGETVTINQARN
ncbi:MAG: BACON domain-containing protein, partial [Acidobacteria bacterium]|nr:BACON domain-containing protein [Acidobacteriota bacterium]